MKTAGKQLRQHLGSAEATRLGQFLVSRGAMTLPQTRGFLTAVASAPNMIMPSTWQPMVLGEPEFESADEARSIIGLVLRLFNELLDDLNEERRVDSLVPEDEGDLQLWCRGYLAGARLDDDWGADDTGTTLLFPMAVLAGEVELKGEPDADGNIIEDPSPQLAACRRELPAHVLALHQHWTQWRRGRFAAPGSPAPTRKPKIGRNEKCPCGSGAKYKKCCGRAGN